MSAGAEHRFKVLCDAGELLPGICRIVSIGEVGEPIEVVRARARAHGWTVGLERIGGFNVEPLLDFCCHHRQQAIEYGGRPSGGGGRSWASRLAAVLAIADVPAWRLREEVDRVISWLEGSGLLGETEEGVHE